MIVLLLLVVAAQVEEVPSAWTCEPVRFADGVCDCGCTDVDDDCSADIACARVGCPTGTTLDDNRLTCSDDTPAPAPGSPQGGCGGGVGAALLGFPLVLRRRRR